MAWLKLDDSAGLEHRKTRRLLRKQGMHAFGLHVLALLHCSRYLTDGLVDREFVEEAMDASKVRERDRAPLTDALVTCGQWSACENGWMINGYLDHNPSKAEVLARRAKDAERKANGRKPPVPQESDRTGAGIHDESERPVPSRPDPVPALLEKPSATPTSEGGVIVEMPERGVA